jgi:hypothetical protein
MADRPILFSASMVRALLDGRKTQTRRIFKGIKQTENGHWHVFSPGGGTIGLSETSIGEAAIDHLPIQVGDRLYVREHWRTTQAFEDLSPSQMTSENTRVKYLADGFVDNKGKSFVHFHDGRHRQAMHMPKWASRLTLIVTAVRVERLQDISRGDAMEEGCPFPNMAAGPDPRSWYADLWNEINGPGAWEANPWVAAYTFTLIRKNIAEVRDVAA